MEQYLINLSPSDISYISHLILKIKNDHSQSSLLVQDCLWRIGTNAELIPPDQLNATGILTSEQTQLVWNFIREFKASESSFSNVNWD